VVPDRCDPPILDDADAMAALRAWADHGGPVLEESVVASGAEVEPPLPPIDLAVRSFDRHIDASWRRTSYSGLIRAAETTGGVSSEPEVSEKDDEKDDETPDALADVPVPEPADAGVTAVPSPMADLPMGAKFGTLVHAVLETADPFASDLAAELEAQIREHSVWGPVDGPAEELAAALVPIHDTPLGPLAPGVTLRRIGFRDRLREMDFEFPLAGGELRTDTKRITLADVGQLFRQHVPAGDPLASYAERLSSGALAGQSLRGYLTGSLDVVLRVGERYVVADYKTNWLGEPEKPLTSAAYGQARMAEAMLHSDYPLQALLYCVVLHRFLRWRQPGYDPQVHLGGV
ncbi:MAG: exodeoxyribonuclease V subunit beta, partial [Mycobacterium sp.]|nr:exodeoxyribonuclease V subunit beta [Mycobacterium sp.]